MFTNIFYMVSFFNFPYIIAFDFESLESQRLFEILLDLIMVVDIAAEFITTREKDGRKIFKVREIALCYIQTTFFFDMMACLPGLVTGEQYKTWFYFKVCRYLQMPRFFE